MYLYGLYKGVPPGLIRPLLKPQVKPCWEISQYIEMLQQITVLIHVKDIKIDPKEAKGRNSYAL